MHILILLEIKRTFYFYSIFNKHTENFQSENIEEINVYLLVLFKFIILITRYI